MNTEPVKDPKGNVIATIETDDRGCAVLRSPDGAILGRYEPERDVTRDKHDNIVAKGNQLRELIC